MQLTRSVIIPARNAAHLLGACLGGVAASQEHGPPPEVIVVDDGSTDATAAVAQAYGARVLRLPGRGPAAARNAGARLASGEILVFFDADCVPEPHCLEALLEAFSDPAVSGARGAYVSRQRALVARFVQLEFEEKQAQLAASREIAVVDTACAAYRRSTFFAYGGFDERFLSSEDVDLSFRLAAAGERLVFVPTARVQHLHPEDPVTYVRRKLRVGYYRARLYQRFPNRLREDGYTPRLMPVQIALAGLLTGCVLIGPWVAAAVPAATAAGLLFLAASLPFTRRAWATDRQLAVLVPPLLLGRSLAQGASLALGLGALALGAARHRGQPACPHPDAPSPKR